MLKCCKLTAYRQILIKDLSLTSHSHPSLSPLFPPNPPNIIPSPSHHVIQKLSSIHQISTTAARIDKGVQHHHAHLHSLNLAHTVVSCHVLSIRFWEVLVRRVPVKSSFLAKKSISKIEIATNKGDKWNVYLRIFPVWPSSLRSIAGHCRHPRDKFAVVSRPFWMARDPPHLWPVASQGSKGSNLHLSVSGFASVLVHTFRKTEKSLFCKSLTKYY